MCYLWVGTNMAELEYNVNRTKVLVEKLMVNKILEKP